MNVQVKKSTLFLLSISSMVTIGFAQHKKLPNKKSDPIKKESKKIVDSSSTKKDSATIPKKVIIKNFDDVIKSGMSTHQGFLTVYTDSSKYYFALPQQLLGRDILSVNRIAKASVDMRNGSSGLAGDEIGEFVYRFEKGPNNKILLRRISFSEYSADSTKSMYWALKDNNVQPIAEVFPIEAYGRDSSVVIDMTTLLNTDNNILYFGDKNLRARAGIGAFQKDKSFLKYVHAYPKNLEVRAEMTYTAGMNPTWPEYTVELNASWILLPERPMQPRYYDPRVGYFVSSHRDFESNPQGVETAVYANRWDLHPRKEDEAKYLKGELVEPETPIVFYVDPNTPKKWIPYLKQGIDDWNVAFEQAGFKNAIQGKIADLKDSTWSIEDASHAAIIYRPSAIANAIGPSIADPRSGQIVESHIFWYHNVMSLLHDWYMIQCGAVDPKAQQRDFSDSLMGELIRFVSSHEVGHTLGLRHNFGSSSTVPVEKLRDKAWVEAHGHTPSIMDYARFNYVAQPEDNISEKGLFPRIGDYDKWAIEWAYRWRPEFKGQPEKERVFLTKLETDSLKANSRLFFGSEISLDPRNQNEDLSDNAMVAGTYGIKNLKRILPHVIDWSAYPDQADRPIIKTYSTVFNQYVTYLNHVIKNIGGVYENTLMGGDTSARLVIEPIEKQKSAVQFINDNLFVTPMWLAYSDIVKRLGVNFPLELHEVQEQTLNNMLTYRTMSRLLYQVSQLGDKAYKPMEYLGDLTIDIFSDVKKDQTINVYRRNLQKLYVARLLQEAFTDTKNQLVYADGYSFNPYMSDIQGYYKTEINNVQAFIKSRLKHFDKNSDSEIHLESLLDMINLAQKNAK